MDKRFAWFFFVVGFVMAVYGAIENAVVPFGIGAVACVLGGADLYGMLFGEQGDERH